MRSALRSWRPAPHSPATSCSISCSSMKLSVSRRKSGATSRFSSSSFSAMLISVIVGPLVVVAWVAPATLTKAHGGLILPPDLHHSRGHYHSSNANTPLHTDHAVAPTGTPRSDHPSAVRSDPTQPEALVLYGRQRHAPGAL